MTKTAEKVIDELRAYDCDDSIYDGDVVVEIVRGIGYSTFVELDERPGQFPGPYEDWHWKLRRARNNHPDFFDAINDVEQ